jgi:hypothetical protein
MEKIKIPEKIVNIQKKLQSKASRDPKFKFYSLYDKIIDPVLLSHSYLISKLNDGGSGLDGDTFKKIEEYGREKWLGQLARQLKDKTYNPGRIKIVKIKTENGSIISHEIINIRDRVVQTAAVFILASIIVADIKDKQNIQGNFNHAKTATCMFQGFFDRDKPLEERSIKVTTRFNNTSRQDMLNAISVRVSDGAVLNLLKMWLEAKVVE